MEKIVERYTMERVFDVIDKHIILNSEASLYYKAEYEMNGDDESLEMYHSHAGGVTALIMVKKELNGECKY